MWMRPDLFHNYFILRSLSEEIKLMLSLADKLDYFVTKSSDSYICNKENDIRSTFSFLREI